MATFVETRLSENEKIILNAEISKKGLIILWIWGIIGAIVVVPLVLAIWITITYLSQELAVTNNKVIGKTGVLFAKTLSAPLDKIQSVYVRGQIITISTAAGKFNFSGIINAEFFGNVVLDQIEQNKKAQVREQALEIATAMANAMKQVN